MKNTDKIQLKKNSSLRDALKIIESGAIQVALVVDDDKRLEGTLSDGDLRRAFLNGKTLEDTIEGLYTTTPTVVSINENKDNILKICTSKRIFQIPVVDEIGHVVGIYVLDELLRPEKHPNKVVLMVGGLSTRLRPLTDNIPKPMLEVGGKPILQTIVEKFAEYGFVNIVMCLNYKSEIIQDFFDDGSRFGVEVKYIQEKKRMGTAGALSLLEKDPEEPFFVMNGDLLTSVNFENFLSYHREGNFAATMAVREYKFQVPYGVVNMENAIVRSIVEKPVQKFFVSAGIYMLDPKCISFIPKGQYFDMPELFEKMIQNGEKVSSFPLREYWLDIGRFEEYEKANSEYHGVF